MNKCYLTYHDINLNLEELDNKATKTLIKKYIIELIILMTIFPIIKTILKDILLLYIRILRA